MLKKKPTRCVLLYMYVKISEPSYHNYDFHCLYPSFSLICLNIFFCRHYLYEQKIARLLWKLEYKDLIFVDNVEEIISPAKRKVSLYLLVNGKKFIKISTTLKQLLVSCTQYLKIVYSQNHARPCQKVEVIVHQAYFYVRGLIDKLLLLNTP